MSISHIAISGYGTLGQTALFAKWVECLPMVRETGVQTQVEFKPGDTYNRYVIPHCLTLSNRRYVSRVK